MTRQPAGRAGAITAIVTLIAMSAGIFPAEAVPQPAVDPALVPADGPPGPGQPMRQTSICAQPISAAEPNPELPAPGFTMLNIAKAWEHSTGNGVPVAVIDTGVQPIPRLPVIGGGDYVMGGDGLADCDAHGTVIASIIAAAPRGTAMPPARPLRPAFPPPAGAQPGAEATAGARNPSHSQSPTRPAERSDGVVGVAPHSTIISIRQSSRAFRPQAPHVGDPEGHQRAGTVATLARAIVHAANLGAKVINVSVIACVPAAESLDQRTLGAAVWYAATVKDAVIVAAAGNEGEAGCAQNPGSDQLTSVDQRDWRHVATISTPSWFSDHVLSVAAVGPTGAPLDKSLSGPWVRIAAPGTGIIGLSPNAGKAVNAYPPPRAGEKEIPFWGTSFSAAYVSGTAALVRAKFPDLSADQVINRIVRTAHSPPAGVDNRIGYGLVDPVAALTFDVAGTSPAAGGSTTRVIVPSPPPPPPDHRARNTALIFAGVVAAGAVVAALASSARRATGMNTGRKLCDKV